MPLPVIANTWRCAINWSLGSAPNVAENVIHVRGPGLDAGTIAGVLDAAVTGGTGFPFDCISDQVHAPLVTITPLDGSGASNDEPLTHWAGINASDGVPATAAILRLHTAVRGRSHRGRMFLPYVAEAQQSLGFIPTVVVNAMQTGWDRFIAQMSAGGADLVVASYVLASADDVTQIFVQSKLGTQRRRQERR